MITRGDSGHVSELRRDRRTHGDDPGMVNLAVEAAAKLPGSESVGLKGWQHGC